MTDPPVTGEKKADEMDLEGPISDVTGVSDFKFDLNQTKLKLTLSS